MVAAILNQPKKCYDERDTIIEELFKNVEFNNRLHTNWGFAWFYLRNVFFFPQKQQHHAAGAGSEGAPPVAQAQQAKRPVGSEIMNDSVNIYHPHSGQSCW